MAPPIRDNRRGNNVNPEESSFELSDNDDGSHSHHSFDSTATEPVPGFNEDGSVSVVNATTSTLSTEQLRMGCCTSRIDNDPSGSEVARSGGPVNLDVIDVIELREQPVPLIASHSLAGPSTNSRQENNFSDSLISRPALSISNFGVVERIPLSEIEDSPENAARNLESRQSLRNSGNSSSPRPALRRSPRGSVNSSSPRPALRRSQRGSVNISSPRPTLRRSPQGSNINLGAVESLHLSVSQAHRIQDMNSAVVNSSSQSSQSTRDTPELSSDSERDNVVGQEASEGRYARISASSTSASSSRSLRSAAAVNRSHEDSSPVESTSGSVRRSLRLSGGVPVIGEQTPGPSSSRVVTAPMGVAKQVSSHDKNSAISESESDEDMQVDTESNPVSSTTTSRHSRRIVFRRQNTPVELLSSTLMETNENDDRSRSALRPPSVSPIRPQVEDINGSSPENSEVADTTWVHYMRDKDFILKSGFSIPRKSFAKVVKSIIHQSSIGYKIGINGMDALQVAAEEFILDTFKYGRAVTRARKARVTSPKDLRTVLKIRKERFYRELQPVQEKQKRRKKNGGLHNEIGIPIREAISPSG